MTDFGEPRAGTPNPYGDTPKVRYAEDGVKPPEVQKGILKAQPLFSRELLHTDPQTAYDLLRTYFLALPNQWLNYAKHVQSSTPRQGSLDYDHITTMLNSLTPEAEKWVKEQLAYAEETERNKPQTEDTNQTREIIHANREHEYHTSVENAQAAWDELYAAVPRTQEVFSEYVHAILALKTCETFGPERIEEIVRKFGIPQIPTLDGFALRDPDIDVIRKPAKNFPEE